MGRILVTGSADGLGRMAAQRLLADGHEVVLHARNEARARDAKAAAPKASAVVIGDLGSISETRTLAAQAYSDSKLFDAVLAFAIAHRWPEVFSNAVDPGWVATRMGGPGAPDDLELGAETQVWLAVSADAAARVSGAYFHHRRRRDPHPAASDPALQEALFDACARL